MAPPTPRQQRRPDQLVIRLQVDHVTQDQLHALATILRASPGPIPVVFEFIRPGDYVATSHPLPTISITPQTALQQEIDHLLGPQSYHLIGCPPL